MDWEQIQYLRDCIQEAIGVGMRDGFASQEKQPPVTVTLPKPIELRDFFAGCALAGWCSQESGTIKGDAEAAYEAADAMLLARGTITAQDVADTTPPEPGHA